MTGLADVARVLAGVSDEELIVWIGSGWIRPDRTGDGFRFSEVDLARARLIKELCRDLAIEADTVPVVLSLLDQIHGLRAELKRLAEAVAAQPEPVRQAITAARGTAAG